MVSQSPQLADLPVGNIANVAPASRPSARTSGADQSSSSFEGMLSSAHEPSDAKSDIGVEALSSDNDPNKTTEAVGQDETGIIPTPALDVQKLPETTNSIPKVAIPLILQEVAAPVETAKSDKSEKALLQALETGQTQDISDDITALTSSDKLVLSVSDTVDVETTDSNISVPGLNNTTAVMQDGDQQSPSLQSNKAEQKSSQFPEIKQVLGEGHQESQINPSANADNGTSEQSEAAQKVTAPLPESASIAAKTSFEQNSQASDILDGGSAQSTGQVATKDAKSDQSEQTVALAKPEGAVKADTKQLAEIGNVSSDNNIQISEEEIRTAATATTQSVNVSNQSENQAEINETVSQVNIKPAQSQSAESAVLAKQAGKLSDGTGTGQSELKSTASQVAEADSDNADSQENPLAKPQERSTKTGMTSTQSENNLAAIRAPKGEAFSRMMAKVEPFAQTLDLMSQTDTSLRTDSFGQLPTETTTVRLTGMEQFARTGQLPTQASLANSQAIAAQISKFAKNGETRFEIKLDPAELGKIDVRLTIGSDGQTRAHLFVERSETLDYLMRDARGLERTLQQSGVDLDRKGLEFSLMDQENHNNMAGQQKNQENDQQGGKGDHIASNDNSQSEDFSAKHQKDHSDEAYLATDGLNMII